MASVRYFAKMSAALLLLASFLPASTTAQTADQLLARIQAKYENLQALSANFTQTLSTTYDDAQSTVTGTLTMSGDKYRFSMDGLTVVTDGAKNWVYTPDENQVTISDYIEDDTAFSPSQFFVTQPERYNATALGSETIAGRRHQQLRLVPKDASAAVKSTTLWVRDGDNLITRLEILDLND
ncbi:MAG: outer membrane lipoprotein carrier protein LolA, partial [Bacteroidota bacterium]